MGLRLEACAGDYWATGANKPTHPLKSCEGRDMKPFMPFMPFMLEWGWRQQIRKQSLKQC